MPKSVALVGEHLANHVFLHKAEVVAEDIRADRQLLIGLAVHEIVQVAVIVEILHVLSLNESVDTYRSVERLSVTAPEIHVADLGADERRALTGS